MKSVRASRKGLDDSIEVIDVVYPKTTMRLLVVAIVFVCVSLASPWWMFVLFVDGELVSTFNLFLWGVIKTGFLRAALPFGWWSYTTFVLVAVGIVLGLVGYRFLARGKRDGKKLVASQVICTIGGCLLYLGGLVFTLANLFSSYQDFWRTAPSESHKGVMIALLSPFNIRYSERYVAFEFLSVGFFFAVASLGLSLLVLYRLTITPRARRTLC